MWLPFLLLSSLFIEIGVGVNLCAGPHRFHCKNLTEAERCGLRASCVPYWRSPRWGQFQVDLSARCTYCLHLADAANDPDAFYRLCSIQPNPSICNDFVNLWKPNKMNKNNGAAFCNIISMCNSHTYIGDLNFGSALCDDCKKVIEDIRELLRDNATTAAITEKLNQMVCEKVPSVLRDYCYETVKAHVPAVLHLIEIAIKPQDICSLIGLCTTSDPMLVSLDSLLPVDHKESESASTHTKCQDDARFSWINRPSAKDHPMMTSRDALPSSDYHTSVGKPSCEECKSVLEQIRAILNDPSMREKMKKEIDDKLCSAFPSFLHKACASAINEHFDEIITNMNTVDLAEVCATFGMCSTLNSVGCASPVNGILQTPLQPGIPVPGACQLCEIVFHKLMSLVLGNATEESITAALESVCQLFPASYKPQCDNFVDRYGAKIIDAIIEGTAPKIFCMTLGLCGSLPISETQVLPPHPVALSRCDMCKMLVTIVQEQLEHNQTIAELEKWAKRLCDALPGSYGQECRTLVDMYLPTFIDYLAKSMSPEEVCQEISLCPAKAHSLQLTSICQTQDLGVLCSSLEVATQCGLHDACLNYQRALYLIDSLKRSAVDSPGCSICAKVVKRWKLFIDLFGVILENGHACVGYTDANDRALCQLVLDNRFKIQQKLMDSTMTPEEMCKLYDLCTSSSPRHPDSVANGVVDKSTEALILVCSVDYKTLCASKRLAELCGQVHFCRSFGPVENSAPTEAPPIVETRVPDLGRNPCTWGPSYWCSTKEAARSCGPHAVAYCLRMSVKGDSSSK